MTLSIFMSKNVFGVCLECFSLDGSLGLQVCPKNFFSSAIYSPLVGLSSLILKIIIQKKISDLPYIHTYPPDSVRNIGRPQRASIAHGCWLELVVRQKTFSHILSRQCASRWLWGILLISFPVGSILKRCGKFLQPFQQTRDYWGDFPLS